MEEALALHGSCPQAAQKHISRCLGPSSSMQMVPCLSPSSWETLAMTARVMDMDLDLIPNPHSLWKGSYKGQQLWFESVHRGTLEFWEFRVGRWGSITRWERPGGWGQAWQCLWRARVAWTHSLPSPSCVLGIFMENTFVIYSIASMQWRIRLA